ncbi:MAG TPA: VacJ family lipoprotein [Candidatus Acidoferrum sp.]|nr:VacJ family lipoprotein [Candidatus Acidoferrum sp.]
MNLKSHLQTLTLVTLTAVTLALPSHSALGAEAGGAQGQDEFFDFDAASKDSGTPTISDPLEKLNRATFVFNDKAYRYVMKPVAKGLRVFPEPVRTGFSNFFSNLGAPVSAISALLQGDPRNAGTELGRFVLNTTVGLLGFLDPATDAGLVQDEEDLGQTMARWGVGHGFYLVVPLYGSSSLRDFTGTLATGAINPLFQNLDTGEVIGITAASAEVSLSLDKDTYEAFYDGAIDPYVFFRSAWVQNRAGKVKQ